MSRFPKSPPIISRWAELIGPSGNIGVCWEISMAYFMDSRGVLYGQKLADPALMRIGLNIIRRPCQVV